MERLYDFGDADFAAPPPAAYSPLPASRDDGETVPDSNCCPICTVEYDDDEDSRPHTFDCCGGSICSACLNQCLENFSAPDGTLLLCPLGGCDLSAALHGRADDGVADDAGRDDDSGTLQGGLRRFAAPVASTASTSSRASRAAPASAGSLWPFSETAAPTASASAQSRGASGFSSALPSASAVSPGIARGARAATFGLLNAAAEAAQPPAPTPGGALSSALAASRALGLRPPVFDYRSAANPYGPGRASGGGGSAAPAPAAASSTAGTPSAAAGSGRGVIKVFWDIENMHLHENENSQEVRASGHAGVGALGCR